MQWVSVGILTYNAMFILEYIMCRFHGKTRSIFLLRVSCGSHGQSGVARWLCPNAFPCAQYFTGNIEYCTTATVSMIKAEQTPLITTVLLAEKTLIFDRRSHLGLGHLLWCYRCLSVWDLPIPWPKLVDADGRESSNGPIIQNGDHVPICSHETIGFPWGFPHLLKDFWCQGNLLHRNLHVPLTHGALVGLLADLVDPVDLVDPKWGLARSALAEMRETYGNHQIHQVSLVNNHMDVSQTRDMMV